MSFFSNMEKIIEREFRKWTQKVFGAAESNELLVIHKAILDEVESKIQTVRRGKQIFPYNRLQIRLACPDAGRQALFQAAFVQSGRLENDIRECLAGAGCEFPAGFSAGVEIAEGCAKPFEVVYGMREIPPASTADSPVSPARLVIVRGKANQESFVLAKARTNIGRLAELTNYRQQVIRRNDVVFEEGADEVNATVSRGHAHIAFDPASGSYRVCDEASEYGTRVFRDGRSIEVPRGSPRGERLRAGDEIYLGRACLRFEA